MRAVQLLSDHLELHLPYLAIGCIIPYSHFYCFLHTLTSLVRELVSSVYVSGTRLLPRKAAVPVFSLCSGFLRWRPLVPNPRGWRVRFYAKHVHNIGCGSQGGMVASSFDGRWVSIVSASSKSRPVAANRYWNLSLITSFLPGMVVTSVSWMWKQMNTDFINTSIGGD